MQEVRSIKTHLNVEYSFYESNNLKSMLIPSSLSSKYLAMNSNQVKQSQEQALKMSKSSSNIIDSNTHYTTAKFDGQRSDKKLSHAMSEIQIPKVNRISRNFDSSESGNSICHNCTDLLQKAVSFSNLTAKLENICHNRRNIKQFNLYEPFDASKTSESLNKNSTTLKTQNYEENSKYAKTALSNYQLQSSTKKAVASLLKSSDSNKNSYNTKVNFARVDKKFEVLSSSIGKLANAIPVSNAWKHTDASSKHRSNRSDFNITSSNM